MIQNRTITLLTLCCLLVISVSCVTENQSDPATPTGRTVVLDSTPSLDNLTWLVGHWQGEAFDGLCEEIWSPPSGGTMTGTFKLVIDDNVSFYELMVLKMENGGPSLSLKHFNADMTGWETKDEVITFPFKKMTENELQLDGLTYRNTGTDSLQIVLTMKAADGNRFHQFINCTRVVD